MAFEAKLEETYREGFTPLYVAAQKGYIGIVEALLEAGAEVNCQTRKGASALYVATQKGHLDIVNLLIVYGADVNLAFETGFTPLHTLCKVYGDDEKKCMPFLKALIAAGANPTAEDSGGRKASYYAGDKSVKNTLVLLEIFTKHCQQKQVALLPTTFDAKNIMQAIETAVQNWRHADLHVSAINIVTNKKMIQAKIWLELFNKINSHFGHAVILDFLLEHNASDSLAKIIANAMGFDTALAAKDVLRTMLNDYLGEHATLLDKLSKFILAGVGQGKAGSSGAYEELLFCFDIFEQQSKKSQPTSLEPVTRMNLH